MADSGDDGFVKERKAGLAPARPDASVVAAEVAQPQPPHIRRDLHAQGFEAPRFENGPVPPVTAALLTSQLTTAGINILALAPSYKNPVFIPKIMQYFRKPSDGFFMRALIVSICCIIGDDIQLAGNSLK